RPLRDLADRMIEDASAPLEPAVVKRFTGRAKEPEEGQLRALADTAIKIFSSQLFIVQEK
ncbi:MAG TPA: hypothetical protein VGD66_05250, partial [Allosphingosinicella sp.]